MTFGDEGGGRQPFWLKVQLWAALLLLFSALYVGLTFAEPGVREFRDIAALLGVLAFGGMGWSIGATNSKGVEAALLADAVESEGAALLIVGPGREVVYANQAFHRLFPGISDAPNGMGASLGEVSVAAMAASIHGNASAEELERLLESATVGRTDSGEICILMPSGRFEWRALGVSPVAKRPGHFLVAARDVTARHELDMVRRSEERLMRDFIDRMPVGFFSSDAEGRFIYLNETFADWIGLEHGEQHGDEGLEDFIVDVGEEGLQADGSVILRGKGGKEFSAYLRQSARRSSDEAFVYSRSVVLRDVAMDEDSMSGGLTANRLKALFDNAPIAIAQLDISGEMIEANQAFAKLLGEPRERIVGKPLADWIKKEDRQDLEVLLSKIVMGTVPAGNFEVRLNGAGGKEKVGTVYAGKIEDGEGDAAGLLLHFVDTTERKHLEIEFTQAQRIQAVGQLAGGVAHDFNNLLTAMIGFCDLLLNRHGPGDPSFADIMQIKQNANRAANLVRQLLAFSRKQTLQPKIIDVTGAIAEMSNLIRRLIGENIELELRHGQNLGKVRVDPGQFDQVIINLAVNARDAMSEKGGSGTGGGGKLSIVTQNVTLDEPEQRGHDLMPAGDYVRIEVSDTGAGISQADINNIFEPFYSTKEVGAGTGLGLSTVHGIIHQTGGFVFVDSAPGEGAVFSIYLPRYEGVESKKEENGESESNGGKAGDLTGDGTILLVEDEDAVRLFASRALSNKGYRVLEAQNAEEALNIIKDLTDPLDLILTDMVMPGMDGYTMVRYIRESRPEVKVVLMSGYAEDAIPEEIGSDDTINFMHKPFSLKELAALVKDVIAR